MKERFGYEGSFTSEDTWRVFRIMSEFIEGFEELSSIGPAVTVFGSARTKKTDPYYIMAQEVSRRLVLMGFSIITGGGPGIMEAANRGAKLGMGTSVGLNIDLPMEQKPNKYVTNLVSFRYFFCRKVMFIKYASAFIIFPGGYGTLDEFFEAITLIQTKKIDAFPVILVGTEYWKGMLDWIKDVMLKEHKISRQDLMLFKAADSVDDVISIIKEVYTLKEPIKDGE